VQDDDSILAEEIDVLCARDNNGNDGEEKDKKKDKHGREEGGEGDKEEAGED
jgi:hypothetical protein